MSDSAPSLQQGNTPRLVGAVTLASVSGLVDAADSLFRDRDECSIDLSGLDESDSATVALLLEWKRRARSEGCRLHFSGMSARLLDIARISQLDGILQE